MPHVSSSGKGFCFTLWLKLQRKSLEHLMHPGTIHNYLSGRTARQLPLIEGKELWVVAAGTVHRREPELASSVPIPVAPQ